MSNPLNKTEVFTTPESSNSLSSSGPMPERIGRYEVLSQLGSGGFGTVYLAFDSQLRREVAIKVPKIKRSSKHDFCQAFMAEARTLAKLDHPQIVPIYDIGATSQHPCYIVSKYIDGDTLEQQLPRLQWGWVERAELVIAVAEALHFAHLSGLVHRDVKPSNVLLDKANKAYLVDFGLALNDEDYDIFGDDSLVGTLSYMSPEQVRGESHLVDGRADIFSLGVLMYELLTGIRPFSAPSRDQIIRNILDRDAKPLRQRKSSVPRELERICMRALERRKAQRYSTAFDMAEELKAFVAYWPEGSSPSALAAKTVNDSANLFKAETADSSDQSFKAVAIVPKGLRAFEREDADFYLEILPGPKDRHGVPESLRFWKHRIEAVNPNDSFRAGIIYGPSGCGKSSFVRAGLLPLLSSDVVPIVLSATAHDTEERLMRSLIAAFPDLSNDVSPEKLPSLLHALRLQAPSASCRTVLLVIDQFEQWLCENSEVEESHLVSALRQCDGIRLKCLFLVRNDFWMSISRLMDQLESPIEQGRNSAAVELFELRHAQKVLYAFGHAYGALPPRADELTRAECEFLEQSVSQLAEEGRIVCLRLAIYAQMVRDKTWEPKTLVAFGGVRGLGARFLEETFYGSTAPLEYSRIAVPAREVLRSLLPPPGRDIRGMMMSQSQLAAVAGRGLSKKDFKQLLRILNDDLRLLTPTDAHGSSVELDSSVSAVDDAEHHYQLTHDYLVPSLRLWLNAKQRETAAGRAQLCLEERTALWEINREGRQLPSWFETLQILLWTSRSRWTASQSSMIAQAKRTRLTQSLVAVSILGLFVAALIFAKSRMDHVGHMREIQLLSQQLYTAKTEDVLPIVAALDEYIPDGDSALMALAEDMNVESGRRFRALLALNREPNRWNEPLLNLLADTDWSNIQLVQDRIQRFAVKIETKIRGHLEATQTSASRLRYAALLAGINSEPVDSLSSYAPELCEALVAADTREVEDFAKALMPCRVYLIPSLQTVFHDASRSEAQRIAAARCLAKYVDTTTLSELILSASPSQHFLLIPANPAERDDVLRHVRDFLQQRFDEPKPQSKGDARQIANGVLTLLRLAQDDALIGQALQQQPFPDARTAIINDCHRYSIPLDKLWTAKHQMSDPIARQAIILAIEPYYVPIPSLNPAHVLSQQLRDILLTSPYQSERSAAQWVLGRWGLAQKPTITSTSVNRPDPKTRDWWLTAQGHTMVILNQPVFAAGPQALVGGRDAEKNAGPIVDYRRFALSTLEISRADLKRFNPSARFLLNPDENDECPANNLKSVIAMRYCRWLSELEEIEESQMCYPPQSEITEQHLQLDDESLNLDAYRLPTEAEWEIACQAATHTAWSHGNDENGLVQFAWHAPNANSRLHPVGTLMPNPWGLFDMHGNIGEWCHPAISAPTAEPYPLRGGNYTLSPQKLASRFSNYQPDTRAWSFTGFRVARSVPTQKQE